MKGGGRENTGGERLSVRFFPFRELTPIWTRLKHTSLLFGLPNINPNQIIYSAGRGFRHHRFASPIPPGRGLATIKVHS